MQRAPTDRIAGFIAPFRATADRVSNVSSVMLRFDSGLIQPIPKRMSQSVRISTLLAFPFVLILLIYPLDIFNKNAAEFGNHPATLTPFFIAMGTTALVCVGVGFLLTF